MAWQIWQKVSKGSALLLSVGSHVHILESHGVQLVGCTQYRVGASLRDDMMQQATMLMCCCPSLSYSHQQRQRWGAERRFMNLIQ